MSTANFYNDLKKGKLAEQAVSLFLTSQGFAVTEGTIKDNFDLTAEKGGASFNVEVKAINWTQKSYNNAVIEVWQNDAMTKRPQWYRSEDVDFILLINMNGSMMYKINAEELRKEFKRKEEAGHRMFRSSYSGDSPGWLFPVSYKSELMGTPVKLTKYFKQAAMK